MANSAARRFVAANQRIARRLEPHLPQRRTNLYADYVHTVADHLNALPNGSTVVDVGAGRACHFANLRKPESRVRLVAVDASAEELALNGDVDETVVADVGGGLPFGDSAVDMVVSSHLLEHLRDAEAFLREAARVLKPGGISAHLLASGLAPFALANRVLPSLVSRRLVAALVPGTDVHGFSAFYDRTTKSSLRTAVARAGLDVVDVRVGYYQADYFSFFLPFFLLMAAYELLISSLHAESLAANILVVARKPSA